MPKNPPLLAKADSLRAVQTPGQVTIYASGLKPTPNSRVWIEPNLLTVFPPEYLLRLQPPAMIDIQIVVPFHAEVAFRAAEPVERVVVYDSVGRHEVPVEHAMDLAPAAKPRRVIARKTKKRTK